MRRAVVVAIAVALIAAMILAPAEAKKKKKKKKKPPVTFTADGSIVTANPADLMGAGITRNAFIETCSIPPSQGSDGYVVEVSDKIGKVQSDVSVAGSDATGQIDLDMYLYSDTCSPMGEYSTASAEEYGVMLPGTKYVVVTAFLGAGIEFTLEATEIR